MVGKGTGRATGRPRSQAADLAIHKAAAKLFFRMPYQDVSMELIAAEAGVSKTTLYRRWPNKAMLAVDVLISVVQQQQIPFESGCYRDHLIKNLKALRNLLASDYADVIVSIIAETQHDAALRELFYQRFLVPVQAIGDADLDRALAGGEIRTVVDKDLVFDQMFGFFYYRLLVAHRPVPDAEIELIADALLTVLNSPLLMEGGQ
jgi:AcrR family transcriptional regulator